MSWKNLALGYVDTAPDPAASGTSLILGAGEGARFPNPATDGPFYVTLCPVDDDPHLGNSEIALVTARSTDTLTLVRTQRSTSARTVIVGDRVLLGVYVEDITNVIGIARQAIINGEPNVWQRGTSFINPANAVFTADRFRTIRADDAAVNILRSSDTPTATQSGIYSPYSLQAKVTTADASIAAGQFYGIMQKLEGDRAAVFGFGQSGTRHITLSFWVKATKTGTYCVSFRNSSVNRSYIAEYSISSSDTWEFKVITIPVDTTGVWNYDNSIGIQICWMLAVGSTYQTTAGSWAAGNYLGSSNQVNALDNAVNNFRLSQIGLCAGDVALPFQPKSFEEELRACQRYYEKSYKYSDAPGTSQSGNETGLSAALGQANNTASTSVTFKVTKRIAPTITLYSYVGTINKISAFNGTSDIGTSISSNLSSEIGIPRIIDSGTGLASGTQYWFCWTAEAEL